MSNKVLGALGAAAAVILVRNLYVMLVNLPDEQFQGAVFRIIFFHVPASFTAFTCYFAALVGGLVYLRKKDLWWDSFAVATVEVGLAFGAINLITGMIWGKIIWGTAWVWDWRLTSALICWLMYAGYLVLRRAIEEPAERARLSAVVAILNFVVVPFVFFSIKWFRTQHPQPVLWGGGTMDSAYRTMLYGNWVPLLLIAIVLVAVRLRQENMHREVEGLRRVAHAF